MPTCVGSGARNNERVAIAPPARCASMSTPRSKSVRLSALIARNMSSPATKSRLARKVPALPSSSGSYDQVHGRWPDPRGDVRPHLVGQMVRVHQHLVDAGLGQRVQPDVEQRPTTDRHQALRRACR